MDNHVGTIDGGLRAASREKLLAGRECKVPHSNEPGHLATRWTICPVCFPGE